MYLYPSNPSLTGCIHGQPKPTSLRYECPLGAFIDAPDEIPTGSVQAMHFPPELTIGIASMPRG